MKCTFIRCVTIVAVILVTFLLLTFLFFLLFGGLYKNPLKPKIKEGEFSFRLEYEIDGKIINVEDSLICEYIGFGADEANGKYRRWKSSLRSGKERITLYTDDKIEIYCMKATPMLGAYQMGDPDADEYFTGSFPIAWQTTDFDNPMYITCTEAQFDKMYYSTSIMALTSPVSFDSMWEKYKLRLINFEISPPIANEFYNTLIDTVRNRFLSF